MTVTSILTRLRPGAVRAVEAAEAIRAQVEAAGPPPAVGHLGPRPRAAYDRVVDALNRLPRPLTVLGSLALIAAALVAPGWFEGRMAALAEMPEGLWWLIGAVVSLYFGGRYQARAQDFEREVIAAVAAEAVKAAAPKPPAPATQA